MTLAPLTWTKIRAGAYQAFDNQGNKFLIRKTGRDSAVNKPIWGIFVNDQFSDTAFKLSAGKRHVEAIARKHHVALKGA